MEPREQPQPTEEMRERARAACPFHSVKDVAPVGPWLYCGSCERLSLLLAQVAEEGRKAGMREAEKLVRRVILSMGDSVLGLKLDGSNYRLRDLAEAIEREASR